MKKSLNYNFLMHLIRTMSGILITLVTFPYLARILGPENLGKIQFAEAFISYFILFINLGIPTYGKREIAFAKDNKVQRSKLLMELLMIQLINTLILSLIYFILINNIKVFKDGVIFYLFFLKIIFNFMDIGWFYVGIEDQEYITKRTIIAKIISLICILKFIRTKSDFMIYIVILTLSFIVPNILGFIRMFKYVKFTKEIFIETSIKRHLTPIFILFAANISSVIFTNFDSLMIKGMMNETSLGYYSLANKTARIPLMITTSIYAVFYPRLSRHFREEDISAYYKLGNLGLDISLLISLPLTIGMFILAPEIIELIGGDQFLEAKNTLRVFSFLITVMCIAYFTGNILVINLKEKLFMKGQIIASIFNVLLNCLLIPFWGTLGAALGTILSELIAIFYRVVMGKEVFEKFNLLRTNTFKVLIATLIMGVEVYSFKKILSLKFSYHPYQLGLIIISGAIIYLISLIILKEKNTCEFLQLKLKKYINS